ncbi:MAG: tRNA (adenosine(37)-N6)-threonylcarbamoyltransferase complex dimerization subunit type 1 TsaB [Candidatus Omnitrophica bacterium 4484_70.1]|nr:MAG: tRNA (adenosine(37)-N6)-threonylcarbamoyltransferase complex dimerization subunit type 1 TsaB [Candidatus Omnitrophica bacterium 4484_70.1]
MKLLGMDCSSLNISLAAMDNDEVIFSLNRKRKKAAAKVIVWLEELLKDKKLEVNDFDMFVIGAGPGSFTGLRISFSIIKAFAFSLKKPVISIGSFYSLAYKLRKKSSKIAVFCDAGRGLIYGATFRFDEKEGLRKSRKESFFKLEDFLRKFKDHMFVTYNYHLRDEVLFFEEKARLWPKNIWPDALSLCRVAKKYFLGKFTSLDRLQPLYIYPKECQVRNLFIAKEKK